MAKKVSKEAIGKGKFNFMKIHKKKLDIKEIGRDIYKLARTRERKKIDLCKIRYEKVRIKEKNDLGNIRYKKSEDNRVLSVEELLHKLFNENSSGGICLDYS